MMTILWNLTTFAIAMSILITVHELGHFWVARYYGVKIEQFSIGFGKALWKYTDRRGTEYSISPILLGGYVKMFNEHVKSIASETQTHSFNEKTIGQRVAIVIAGPITNFIFAIFSYWLIFMTVTPNIRPVIGEVIPNSIADNAKIVPGMEIKAVDGVKTPDWKSVRLQVSSKINVNSIIVSVMPFGSDQQQKKVLNIKNWDFNPGKKEDPLKSLGIHPTNIRVDPILTKIKSDSVASKAGLLSGDRIVKINGKPLSNWETFVNLIRNNPGKLLNLEIERKGRLFSIVLVPDLKINSDTIEGFIGVVPKVTHFSDRYNVNHWYNPFIYVLEATNKTWHLMKVTVKTLGKLVTGNVELSNLSGPISIAREAGISAKFGISYYFMFLAFISVNLGIMNLFPLPILDGGNILFLAIEKIRGDFVSDKIQNFCYRISVILLVLLVGIALFNDFSRL